MTVDLIDIFSCSSIIGIDPINVGFFLTQEGYFIAYKSSTTWDPPRPLPGAEVRNKNITGNYYV
jgi:hypothetical protein